jgi:hypothetical protein
MFECLQCAEGCESCKDDRPCIVSLNWVMRTAILILSCVIICCLPVVVLFTWKYGNVKVGIICKVLSIVFTVKLFSCSCFRRNFAVSTEVLWDKYLCYYSQYLSHFSVAQWFLVFLVPTDVLWDAFFFLCSHRLRKCLGTCICISYKPQESTVNFSRPLS